MAMERPAEPVKPDTGDDGDGDYTPPPREAFDTQPQLCKDLLRSVTSSFPLEIRPSQIAAGSGLFAGTAVEAGREIYRSTPLMAAIDFGNESICHYCLKDVADKFGTGDSSETEDAGDDSRSLAKACTGCRVARFCSKQRQKAAWSEFHKDECKTLQKFPRMKAQHLLAHRLVFWQQRKFITTLQGKAISFLETHFCEYSEDGDRNTEIFDIALAVRKATGEKVNIGLVWKIVPALRANCVRIRPAAKKESIGYALDLVTAVINHSCDPNAFAFFEGRQLRVRSLRKIAAGEEITICYLDPTIYVAGRQDILKREHFFVCECKRCKSELREQVTRLGSSDKFPALHQAQREILDLIKNAVTASRYPGVYKTFEDLPAVETQLRTMTSRAFHQSDSYPNFSPWPDHMDPLPLARLSLAMLYLAQDKPAHALRNALRGKLLSRRGRGGGPGWVNEMMDVLTVLIAAGSLPPDAPAFEDKSFPSVEDIRAVAYGYAYEACREAGLAFGGDAEYTRGICDMFASMVAKKPGARPGSREFGVAFEVAQGKLMAWAGIPGGNEVVLSS
ncbi:hypothetical protein VTK56DRAFT_2294 [Thermocarpiscus australiensis]